ncbi:hypothetical protein [Psychrobacter sp. MES7-P7E]|uniref:hypothetical protein n=1 Tax=Psychrobacter sp. MES7-P7E TaxID=2058322 RepID=UPI000C7F5508|nr:hypothetical protein [Psychrobacter sp. MES7-P7E]PLT21533.1 hypothetical protein CXF62_09910 [Psychrobacter sp. MES7-P7E]
MSQSKPIPKLISRFEIGFDNETKVEIGALKSKLDEVLRGLSAKNDSHGDRLLAAMLAEAANDSPVTSSSWENDLNLSTVNDVDYLSGSGLEECVPRIDDVLDQPNWLSESAPQITQADMQLIFIKNLSECLVQRMHSMDRFSEDDYAIGGDKLMAWDILIYEPLNSYAVLIDNRQKPKIADLLVFWNTGAAADANWNTDSGAFATLRTITEAELPAFRAALEACYA